MSLIKTTEQIAAMREGGQILALILKELEQRTAPGMTTLAINKMAEELFKKYQVIPSFLGYNGFPATICTAINEEVVHGIPNEKIIKEGDIFSIDAGVYHKGLHTDSAITFAIGNVSSAGQKLIKETTAALYAGIDVVKPGNRVGDISFAIEQHLKKHQITPISDLVGHGIGENLHEPPQVPNIGKKGSGLALKPGMVIAIEPITCLGSERITTLPDKWTIITKDNSLACQQEHTVLVTNSGVEILTALP